MSNTIKPMMYLCHKCGGHLTENTQDASAYGCKCISGYVRDWQSPIALPDVREIQRKHMHQWLNLFISQKRPESDGSLQWARKTLAKLA